MKKIITILLIIAILTINLVGCSDNKEEFGDRNRFKLIERYDTQTEIAYGSPVYIFVDTETNVMYLKVHGGNGGIGLTALVDADGKPLLWKGE